MEEKKEGAEAQRNARSGSCDETQKGRNKKNSLSLFLSTHLNKHQALHCLDRDGRAVVLEIDPSEYVFKLALSQ